MKRLVAFSVAVLVLFSFSLAVAKKKKKKSANNRGSVLLDNPYGKTSSEWATVELFPKKNFEGKPWLIDVYGTKVTIKNPNGIKVKKFKGNYFKSAKVSMSSTGGVYFYDDNRYNRENTFSYGWAYIPSNYARIGIPDFDKADDTTNNLTKSYYKINNADKGKKISGNISSIIIKFSKMR